jgi:hypothetical protein
MKLDVLLVSVLVFITAGVMGITGCAVTVQPTSEPSPYYQPSPGPTEGDVSYFYDQLVPYGEWSQLSNYGWVWAPHDVPLGWRPYTHGRWVYTDYGWTWVSDWEWGWAPFHYGRWIFDPYRGWVWIPGRDWAPAWVAWHYGNGWVGWAPLPPGIDWRTGVNIEAHIRPQWWCFVEERFVFERNLRNNIILPARNITYLSLTRNVTNYTMIQNRVFNRSLSAEEIERRVQKPIPRYRITDRDTPPAVRDRVKGNDIYMFRRQFAEATPSRIPPKVEPHKPTGAPGGRTGVVTPQVQRPSQSEILERQQSELKQLNARHQQEMNKLQEIHKKEIKQPPKGTSLEAIQKKHEAEQRAIAEQHQQEKNLLKQRHEREQKGEVQYYKK